MPKQCFKCKTVKSLSEFYKHPAMADGHLGKCITCARRDVSERVERLSQDPLWLAKERDRHRRKQARYRALGLAAKATQESRLKWAKSNKRKVMAERKANNAVRSKKLIKPEACQECHKATPKLEKHHPDYSKPLNIQWLCSACHGKTRRIDDDIIP